MRTAKKILFRKIYMTLMQWFNLFPLPPNERESKAFFERLEEIHDRSRKKESSFR